MLSIRLLHELYDFVGVVENLLDVLFCLVPQCNGFFVCLVRLALARELVKADSNFLRAEFVGLE